MIDVASVNRVVIAVSSGSTITSESSFSFFQFQHDQVGPTPNADSGGFADYDTLGVDASALYIGVNVFNSTGSSCGCRTAPSLNRGTMRWRSMSVMSVLGMP